MNKKITISLLILFGVLIFCQDLSAQDRRIFGQFRKLEYYIMRVEEIVKNFNDSQAENLVLKAREELEKARFFLYTSQPSRPVIAQLHMAAAKQYADQAAKLVLQRPFDNLKSQLDQLIDRAEQATLQSNSDEANYLLSQAKKFRRWAYSSFKTSEPVKGQEYYRISFFFARKCLDYVSRGEKDIEGRLLDLEVSITQLLNQAESIITGSGSEELERLLNDARLQYEEAMRLADAGKEEMAIRRLRLVERLLYRLFDQAERLDSKSENKIENSMYSLDSYLQALTEDLESSSNAGTRETLEKAWNLYREAKQAFQNGNYREAQVKIALSQRLAHSVFRQLKKNPDRTTLDVQDQLDETRKLLDLQREQVQNSQNTAIKNMYAEAAGLLDRAQEALNQYNPDLAFRLVQAATRMTARIQRELKQSSGELKKQALEEKLQRLENLLQRLESNDQIMPQYAALIAEWRTFADKARESINNGNYVLAEEYINTALYQVKEFTDKWQK